VSGWIEEGKPARVRRLSARRSVQCDRGVQYFPDRAGVHEKNAGQRTREFVLNSQMRSTLHFEKLNKNHRIARQQK